MNQRPANFNTSGRNNPGRQQSSSSRQRGNEHRDSNWKQNFKSDWIRDKLVNEALSFAESFGKDLTQGFTTSQIRNFFGEVRRIQMKGVARDKTAFLLLKPKLAYAAKRAELKGDKKAKDFNEVIEAAHTVVMEVENNPAEFTKRFGNFVDLLESILAYHKAYGGK